MKERKEGETECKKQVRGKKAKDGGKRDEQRN